MTNITGLTINSNVTEIPSNAIKTIGGQESQLRGMVLKSVQDLTIRSNSFQNAIKINIQKDENCLRNFFCLNLSSITYQFPYMFY